MPYQRSVLSLDEAHKAMDRTLQEAFKAPDRPVAIAICDDQGELVTFARMDKCAPLPSSFPLIMNCSLPGFLDRYPRQPLK